jgi:hypothetical protein
MRTFFLFKGVNLFKASQFINNLKCITYSQKKIIIEKIVVYIPRPMVTIGPLVSIGCWASNYESCLRKKSALIINKTTRSRHYHPTPFFQEYSG